MRPRSVAPLIVPVLVLLSCADPVAPDYGARVSFYEAVDIALAYLEEEGLYENGDSIAFLEVESHLDAEGKGADWELFLQVNDKSYKVIILDGEARNYIIFGHRDGPFILTQGLLDTDTIMSEVSSIMTVTDEMTFVLTPSIEGYNYPCWKSEPFETTVECYNYVGPNINLYFLKDMPVVKGEYDCNHFQDWSFYANIYNGSMFEAQESYIKYDKIYYYYIKGSKLNENQWSYHGYVVSEYYNDDYSSGDSGHEIINGVAEFNDEYEGSVTDSIYIVCDAYDGSVMLYLVDEE